MSDGEDEQTVPAADAPQSAPRLVSMPKRSAGGERGRTPAPKLSNPQLAYLLQMMDTGDMPRSMATIHALTRQALNACAEERNKILEQARQQEGEE